DHTTGVVYDRQGYLATIRFLLKAEHPSLARDTLATLGDSLALLRESTSASGFVGRTFDVGAYEKTQIVLVEVDAQGRTRRRKVLAAGQFGHAATRLYERYAELLPDGPERVRAAATARAAAAALGPFDLDRYATGFAPEIAYVDRRTLGLPPARGAEAVLHLLGTMLEVADGVTTRIDDILALRSDALLARWTNVGIDRAGGGAYERPFLWLGVFGAGGLLTRIELFDADRVDQALARFDELTSAPSTPAAGAAARAAGGPRRVRPNRGGAPPPPRGPPHRGGDPRRLSPPPHRSDRGRPPPSRLGVGPRRPPPPRDRGHDRAGPDAAPRAAGQPR